MPKVLESLKTLWRKSNRREQEHYPQVLLSQAFITMLADATGSISIAALIVGSVYLVAVVVLIILRKRLFLKFFTSLFSGIIEQDESEERLKPLLLMIVKNLRDNLEC